MIYISPDTVLTCTSIFLSNDKKVNLLDLKLYISELKTVLKSTSLQDSYLMVEYPEQGYRSELFYEEHEHYLLRYDDQRNVEKMHQQLEILKSDFVQAGLTMETSERVIQQSILLFLDRRREEKKYKEKGICKIKRF